MKQILSVLVLILLLCSYSFAEDLSDFWLDFGVASHLPRPELESGDLEYEPHARNTEADLSCRLNEVTNKDFLQYIEKLKAYGYTTITEAGFDTFSAYHTSTEYSVYVEYSKKGKKMTIRAYAHEPTVYDVLKYLFNTYKPELLCKVCPQLASELERFGYSISEPTNIDDKSQSN